MEFYDMHTHILPGIDDGSETVQNSVLMLECLKKQGVTNVCFTPHMYSQEINADDFLQLRQGAFEKLKPHLPDGMKFCLGAEVLVTDYLFVNDNLSRLCYGGKRYMLTEFPYKSLFQGRSNRQLCRLINDYSITPVIPHIERYPALMKNPELRDELREMGVIFQTNTSSFEKISARLKLGKLIKNGEVDLFGTDTHSFGHNTPESYMKIIELLKNKGLKKDIEEMQDVAKRIFVPVEL